MNTTRTIWDLLDFVESSTGRKFITADKTNAAHHQQFWYNRYIAEYRCTKYFSNRPFPKAYNQKPVRQKEYLGSTEQFIRIDAELPNHSEVPSQETRDGFIMWAKNSGALGTLQTPHGSHAYFLFDTPFAWSNAKQIVQQLFSTYTGEYIVCDASWCTSDWSRTNNNKNCNLDFFIAQASKQHTFPYCETNSNIQKKELNTSKPKSNNKKSAKSRKGGSRQENNDEFKRVWWDIKDGKSIDAATSNLQFHTKAEIVKAMNDPRYAIKGKRNGQGNKVGTVLDAESPYAGNFSDTRLIQRTSTVFAQIAHSISDLRELPNARAVQIIETVPKFKKTLELIIGNMGTDWKPQICQLLDNNRNAYGTDIGRLWVSKVVLDIVLAYISNVKTVTCKELNAHLRLTLPLPCTKHAQHGSSPAHTKRILTLLVQSDILLPHYAGRSTHYTTVPINAILLDKLSSNNLKRSSDTTLRDMQTLSEDQVNERPARVTSGLQVTTGSKGETKTSQKQDSKRRDNFNEPVGVRLEAARIQGSGKFKSDLYRLETSLKETN